MQQRIGIIDLGSNTTRLIVMGYTPHHSFKLLDEVRETVRLAEGIGADGCLQPKPMRRAIETMKLFHSFCRASGVQRIIPAATSATREAMNRNEFLTLVEREAGLRMRVLSAEEEAYYGYLGLMNSINLRDGFVIDIGGGSTQVTKVKNRHFEFGYSRPIGALRAAERFLRSDPITSREFRTMSKELAAIFTDIDWFRHGRATELAGMGGTIRTLAEMDMKANDYPLDRVHGYCLTRSRLEAMIDALRGMTQRQREALPGLNRDRADLILPGAMILYTLMRLGKFDAITVSGQGLREGLFYEHFLVGTGSLFDDMRNFSIQNLARIYNYEVNHVHKVRELSLSLFDQLRPLHGYGAWERELLEHSALIHDIGVAVGYYDHHKHGAYLVLNAALQGFTHREIIFLASLVRYHRKGDVQVDEFRPLLELGDPERIAKLASLLRLAENLERRKSQVIYNLKVTIGETIEVLVEAEGDTTVEIWDANRRAGLFQKSFGRPIMFY
jgi:exopolyphosphatase/guanosine-5'-triphosphate,3'-diphosphate pyrophosphatase